MSKLNPCEAVQEQLSAYLDDELTQQEQQRIYLHVQQCPECSTLLQELESMRTDVKDAVLSSIDTRDLPTILHDQPARWLGWIGWSLFALGVLLVGAFFAWELASELLIGTATPWWFRLGIAGLYLGLAALFLSVLRQRIVARKTDKYKKVNL
ncbi:zf-HC2 domain-containing protein [Aliidiomarina shirensis]|nr:zf-HC2 domain-containing protein [Aliidiomarina shirensis]